MILPIIRDIPSTFAALPVVRLATWPASLKRAQPGRSLRRVGRWNWLGPNLVSLCIGRACQRAKITRLRFHVLIAVLFERFIATAAAAKIIHLWSDRKHGLALPKKVEAEE